MRTSRSKRVASARTNRRCDASPQGRRLRSAACPQLTVVNGQGVVRAKNLFCRTIGKEDGARRSNHHDTVCQAIECCDQAAASERVSADQSPMDLQRSTDVRPEHFQQFRVRRPKLASPRGT